MAQEQEEIIIIEEADAAGVELPSSTGTQSRGTPPKWKNKRFLFIAGGAVLLLGLGSAALFLLSGDHETAVAVKAYEEPLLHPKRPMHAPIEPSELEKMIERANFLYTNGNQAEALKLFEKIALYSEAISQYNLGVVQLKEGEYEGALANFKRSIANSDNRCVSAINAAVCCLYLGQDANFRYYIDMAQAYLPKESTSPLYSYYYSLIQYYKGHYLEALSALDHPTTDAYKPAQEMLKAKINTLFGDHNAAIKALDEVSEGQNSFFTGLLYANKGDLSNAKHYLNQAIMQNSKPIEEQLALSFVYLKSGQQEEAGGLIEKTTDAYPKEVYVPYPIRVYLKQTLFNPEDVQKTYRNSKNSSRQDIFQTIFYFAPYKVFNANQTISYIRKGTASIYIDNISGAKEYLQQSAHTSDVNYGIALAIQKALTFRVRDANLDLQKLLQSNPKHSILNYNLALTYAQLGDYTNAYQYFLRSYHLDADNYLSGIFAIMSSELISKSNPKLVSILKDNLSREAESEEFTLYRTLVDIAQNNFPSSGKWLDNPYKDRPLYLAMKVLIASELGVDSAAQKASEKLTYLQPADLLPHLMYIDTHFKDQNTKAFASSALNYLKKQPLKYDDLYFGPLITREKAAAMGAMTGQLTPMIERLKNKLQTTTDNTADITGALALAYFYNQDFEEAYTLYNQLVDTHQVKDEHTLFMGAAASIGAEHYQNAIVLLELSKIKNPKYPESRYALGLLYLQIQNNPAAAIQFQKMGNTGFVSNYFDFAIDTDKLAIEPEKYHSL